jgi:hypothetical protein
MTFIMSLQRVTKTAQKGLKIELIISMPKSYAPRFQSPSGPDKVTFRASDDKKPTFEGRFFIFRFL